MNDKTFDALAHEQRRTLLLDILESNPQDAGVELPTGESAPTDAERRVWISMYHSHLPKLEDYGYIEWNRDAQEVVKGPQFEEIRPLLEWVDDQAELPGQNGQVTP
ncbi:MULTISPECIES: DUF7344 domain-containing protein [Salinibaculum]|uniref:DUF7344 domain-containing protein n=1 Tax=Salinibaculum TaxID=2732368 RepID=UPI0030D408B8